MYSFHLPIRPSTRVILAILLVAVTGSAQTRKNFQFAAAPGASVSVLNEYGPVSVRPVAGPQIIVTALIASEKVTVDATQKGNRIEFRTRMIGRPSDKESRVEYQVQVPPDSNVTIRSSDGPLRAEGLRGDVTIEGEAATVEVATSTGAHIHVQTVTGSVTLTNARNAYVDATSVAGSINMTDVSGPKIAASTGSGKIRFMGDCAGGGTYSFVNHAGDTEVILPTTASVDVSARSLKGRVLNQFPFSQKQLPDDASGNGPSATANSLTNGEGKAFTATSNAGASSIRINSFSGTITVRKQ